MKKTLLIVAAGVAIGYVMAGTLAKYPPFSNAFLLGANSK